MVKQVKVSYRQPGDLAPNSVSSWMDQLPKQDLEYAPWPSFPYKPQVQFTLAHDGDQIYIKYYVREKEIRANVTHINGPVWEDSCVEFFISFDEQYYYNIECNCIGTLLVGYGKGKEDRLHLNPELITKIKSEVFLAPGSQGVYWELMLTIPKTIFVHNEFATLKDLKCRCNFYKCGDLLAQPCFLSWSNIEYPEPNFHLPQFFGEMILQ